MKFRIGVYNTDGVKNRQCWMTSVSVSVVTCDMCYVATGTLGHVGMVGCCQLALVIIYHFIPSSQPATRVTGTFHKEMACKTYKIDAHNNMFLHVVIMF